MIHNLIVNYNKSPIITNIEHSEPDYINSFTQKIKFYNPEINEPLHKYWYFIPNAKLISKTSHSICLALSSNDTNLINSLKSLDEKTSEIMINIDKKYKQFLKPFVESRNNLPPQLTISIDSKSKCFDAMGSSTKYMNFENGCKIQTYIEFDSIVIKEHECYRKWRVLQIKIL
jgi:hypothetical protein